MLIFFIGISGTGKNDNFTFYTCDLTFYTCENNSTTNLKTVVYITNRKIHDCLEILDIFHLLNMISHRAGFETDTLPQPEMKILLKMTCNTCRNV